MRSISKIFLALGLMLGLLMDTVPSYAQTFSEWFRQKKTQKRYLLEQIAALQVYIGYARQGYEIVGSGLQTVRNITKGEFGLHDAFISGLKKVSPAVREDVRVAEIISIQIGIVKAFGCIGSNGLFSADQLAYIADVSAGVIAECYTDLEELLLVITSGKVEMTDDQRLSRIGSIYERMSDKSAFVQNFCNDVTLVIHQKKMEQNAVENLRRYYGID